MTTTILTPTCHLQSISLICNLCHLTISSTRHLLTTSILLTSTCSTIFDYYTEGFISFSVVIIDYFIQLTHSHMFIQRSSSCCDGISVDLLTGTASVLYKSGAVYNYSNVSRRAIANLMLNPNISLGFWINANLVDNKRVAFTQTYDAIPTCC